MRLGSKVKRALAVMLAAVLCLGWVQPGMLSPCLSLQECSPRAEPAGHHAGHVQADALSGQMSAQGSPCSDQDDQNLTPTCCQPSPAVLLLVQQPAPPSRFARVSPQGLVLFLSLRPDSLFRPPQSPL
ncbi:MAG: hypothetical protein LBP61_01735 [Desulfovibrio sp.]|jgi:hypothetical protein|nr:hypothetical protein [Desulfovibrio sp.]